MGMPVSNEATDEKKQILVLAGSLNAECVADLDPIIWFLQQKIYIPVGRNHGSGLCASRTKKGGHARSRAWPLANCRHALFARVNRAYLPK
jgi:hypothetical protein